MDIRHTSKHSGSSERDRGTSGVPSVASTAQLSRTHTEYLRLHLTHLDLLVELLRIQLVQAAKVSKRQ